MPCFCSAVSDRAAQKRQLVDGLLAVGVPRQLDLDHPVEVVAGAAGLGQALVDGRQQLVAVELLALARGADEPVTGPAGVPRHERAAGGDVDGDRLVRAGRRRSRRSAR